MTWSIRRHGPTILADLRHADPQRRQSQEGYVVKRARAKAMPHRNALFYGDNCDMVYAMPQPSSRK